jgi:hypothetical protein
MTLYKADAQTLEQFCEMSNGYVDIYIVDRSTAPQLLSAFMGLDPTAQCIVHAINHLVASINKSKPGHGPLCLDCDTEFHSKTDLLDAWMVMVPFANTKGAIVTAICEDCVTNKDIQEASLRVVRKLWPSAFVDPSRNQDKM